MTVRPLIRYDGRNVLSIVEENGQCSIELLIEEAEDSQCEQWLSLPLSEEELQVLTSGQGSLRRLIASSPIVTVISRHGDGRVEQRQLSPLELPEEWLPDV